MIKEGGQEQQVVKDMYSTGRRSAISTSELGLYSDHSHHYNNNTYSTNVRKLVIGIMVVFSVILIGIFLYDFTLSASVNSRVSQETKHIYILQNSLRKPSLNATRRSSVTIAPTIYIVNSSHSTVFEDRSDDDRNSEYKQQTPGYPVTETRSQRQAQDEPETRMQNLQNFKLRDRMLDRTPDEIEPFDRQKSTIDNHAMMYRVSKMKLPVLENEETEVSSDDSQRATPFRFELTGPPPATFKRSKYPQLSQYQYPHASRNIQEIIKYLTDNPESLNRGIKFTGYYMNPKKYDTEVGEFAMNSDKSEEVVPYAMSFNTDPLYQYKPKHPADVNLLATSNFRFSPIGLHRYNSYYDSYYQRPNPNKHSIYPENQYDNAGSYVTANYGKKRKPKPFSVMLDIYPITDATDQNKKSSSRLKSPTIAADELDSRRSPIPVIPYHPRYQKAYGAYTQAAPILPVPSQQIPAVVADEEEKHQMILHLNVYPKRKGKMTRNDVIERSEATPPPQSSEKQEMIDRLIIPFDEIAKRLTAHAAVEEAKYDEEIDRTDSAKVRYEETPLTRQDVGEIKSNFAIDHFKVQVEAEKLIATTDSSRCNNCEMITTEIGSTTSLSSITTTTATVASTTTDAKIDTTSIKNADSTAFKDIDTIEGFQKFADSLIAMD